MRCAVGKCLQSSSKKTTVSFYRFPKNEAQRKLWIKFCNRLKPINVKHERICALHFKQVDFERNLKFEMGLSNHSAPKLVAGAVPTIDASTSRNGIEISDDAELDNEIENPNEIKIPKKIETLIPNKENSLPMTLETQEDSQQIYLKHLETKIDAMCQEFDTLRMLQNESAITINKLSLQVQTLSFANVNLEKALSNLFTEGQIKKLKNGNKKQNFTEEDIAQSTSLYSTSANAYRWLRKKQFPLPSVRTLQRWSQKLDMSTGILKPVAKILSAANQMSETEKVFVLSFDEMNV